MKPLVEYRKSLNLSQRELAAVLRENNIKVSPAAIAMYEKGYRQPPLEKARKIARFFGVATDDIVFGEYAHDTRTNTAQKHAGDHN
jgi:transcriptional regulator with XRE-family HTH domain